MIVALAKITVSSSSSDTNSDILTYWSKKRPRNVPWHKNGQQQTTQRTNWI